MSKVLKSRSGKLMHISNIGTAIKYGVLYNGYAARKNSGSGIGSIAPDGWRVPSSSDILELKTFINNNDYIGAYLKEAGTLYWNDDLGTNMYGFNARGAGIRQSGYFGLKDFTTYYLSDLYCFGFESNFDGIVFQNIVELPNQTDGYSIRCLLNNPESWYDGMTITDIEGNTYPTIKIGDQAWMAANLAVTKYNDGTPIPNVTGNSEWAELSTGAMCYYDNNINNAFETIYLGNKILRKVEPMGLKLIFVPLAFNPEDIGNDVSAWNTLINNNGDGRSNVNYTSVYIDNNKVILSGDNSATILNLEALSLERIDGIIPETLLEFNITGNVSLTRVNVNKPAGLTKLNLPICFDLLVFPDLLVPSLQEIYAYNNNFPSSEIDKVLTYYTTYIAAITQVYLDGDGVTQDILDAARAANPQCSFVML